MESEYRSVMPSSKRRTRAHPYNLFVGLITWIVVVYETTGLYAAILGFLIAVGLGANHSTKNLLPFWRRVWSQVSWSVPLMVIYVVIRSVFSPTSSDAHILWQGPRVPLLGTLQLTLSGVTSGAVGALRLWSLLIGVAAITRGIEPDDVVIWLGRRFARAGLTISMMMNFLPLLQQEFGRIREYVFARGAIPWNSPWQQRIRALGAVLQALLMNALDRSFSLAESMYVRGYGGASRSFYRKAPFHLRDSALMAGWICLMVISMRAGHLGPVPPQIASMFAVACTFLILLWMGGRLSVHRQD